jgi:hypothetical protein
MSDLAGMLADSDSELATEIHQIGRVIASIMGFKALSHGYQLA